jgi:hypothetical protein
MRTLYLRILSKLEKAGFPVFERRIRLGRLEKTLVAVSTFLAVRRRF